MPAIASFVYNGLPTIAVFPILNLNENNIVHLLNNLTLLFFTPNSVIFSVVS
jgi:hypothetical protein